MNKEELIQIIENEGNFEEWIESEYLCRIRRTRPIDPWCGYVRIPYTHPVANKSYDDIDVEVHGGLTYGNDSFPDSNIKDGYWYGFDCGHAGDLYPPNIIRYDIPSGDVYRTKEYVKNECKKLAKQLKKLENP